MDPQTVDMLTFIYTNSRALRKDRAIKAITEQPKDGVSYTEHEQAIQEAITVITEDETLGLEEDILVSTVLGKRKRQLDDIEDQRSRDIESVIF